LDLKSDKCDIKFRTVRAAAWTTRNVIVQIQYWRLWTTRRSTSNDHRDQWAVL